MKVIGLSLRLGLVVALLSLGPNIFAQPGPNPGGGGRPCAEPPCGPPGDPDPPGRVPIGGIEILIAAGAALGAGRLAARKSANQPE